LNGVDPKNIESDGLGVKLGLRLKLGDPMTVHTLTDSVCKKIQNVKIEFSPSSCPLFLKTPFLLEARPGSFLFEDVDAIGGYFDDDDNLILLTYTQAGTHLSKSNNLFNGTRLDHIDFVHRPGSINPPENDSPNVLPFIMVLALILEADKTPVRIDSGTKKSIKRNKHISARSKLSDWIERRMYIDATISSKKSKITAPMNKDGKEKHEVQVKCFVRQQAYGPGHSLRKSVYVEEHQSTRWIKAGDRKITLDTYFS